MAVRPRESNALTQIAIELTVMDNCYGDPGHVAGRREAAQQGVVNAHDASMAGGAFQFYGCSSRSREAGGALWVRSIGSSSLLICGYYRQSGFQGDEGVM
jgi:hypothetical protein